MDYSLGEDLNSMMRSVSKNIGLFDLDPQPLHTGSHGQIFHITNRHDLKSHVLKVFWKHNNSTKEGKHSEPNYQSEKRMHESLKNRYIVRLHNTFQDDNNSYLVLQYCAQGNLRSKMQQPMQIEQVRDYGLQIAKGLAYLHKNEIIHGDLKPENILLTAQNQVKLCDFGMAVKCPMHECVKKFRGSVGYAAPEAIELHNHKLDVWSLGCLLHEMATGKLPFAYSNWKQLSTLLTDDYLRKFAFSNLLTAELVHLLKKIFVYEKDSRPSVDELMNHPFFTGSPLPVETEKNEEKVLTKRSSSGKAMIRSLEPRQENKENRNRTNLPLKSTLPDYKKLLQTKFKKEELHKDTAFLHQAVHTSGDKPKSKAKDSRPDQANKPHLTTRQQIISELKRELSPLSTGQMVIKPLKIKHSVIEIDQRGYTRHTDQQDNNLWFNVSCDGKLVKLQSKQGQKQYKLEQLPMKYHKPYEEAKRIVRGIQSEEARLTYSDAKNRLQMKIMYDGSVQVKLGESQLPPLTPQDLLLPKNRAIADKDYGRIRAVYMALKGAGELTQ